MEKVKETLLDNGIRVISERISHVKSFSLGFWVQTGSNFEGDDVSGISHFIEHMLFKGTRKRSARRIAEDIEAYGGYMNAFTSKEHTCYYGRGRAKYLRKTFDVFADMIQNPLFRDRDIANEKGVILDELRDCNDNPDDMIFDKFEEVLFAGNPLGNSILGREESITSFNNEILHRYHSGHYFPSNMLISASGNISHELLTELASKLIIPKNVQPELQIVNPFEYKPEEVILQKNIEQDYCILGNVTSGNTDDKRYVKRLLSLVLGEGSASRLYQTVRERMGMTYQINSFVQSYKDLASFGIYFSTNPRQTGKVLSTISKELKKFNEKGISEKELKKAKEYMKGSMLLSLESTSNRMIKLANSYMNYKRLIPFEEVLKMIDAVTVDEVNQLSKELLDESRFSKVYIKSNSKIINTAA
ncbi:MAG: insulinase family protein [Ignavibacteriaceae bacterium]|nr:insulinase family protein [Ignavibacteriaceae bacterium]